MTRRALSLRLLVALLVLGVIGIIVCRTLLLRMVVVPTSNMMNTIIPGDHLVIRRSFGDLNRGDIVMFQFPNDAAYYIKRVVGLPGETIQVRGKAVYINERVLEEQQVMVARDDLTLDPLEETSSEGNGTYRVFYSRASHEEDASEPREDEFGTATPYRIQDDSYFLMGDNRDNSYDSRYRGAVPRNLVWGKASVIYYSVRPKTEELRGDRILKRVQ